MRCRSKLLDLWQDTFFSVRLLRKRPLFVLAVIASLALGIGLSTAVFSFLNALLLRPLPGVAEPQSLVLLASGGRGDSRQLPISSPNYLDLARRTHVFSGLAAYQVIRVGLATADGEAEQVPGEIVSGNFFAVLGAPPILGRDFSGPADRPPGTQPEVILGYGLWQKRFGADPQVLGQKVLLNGQAFAVVGVARRDFKGTSNLSSAALWVPLSMYPVVFPAPKLFESRKGQVLRLIGRLRPGVGPRPAAAEVRAISARLAEEYPAENAGLEITLAPLIRPLRLTSGPVKAGAFLMIVMGFLLVIVCLNVANMLLVRAVSRRRELAIRLSLGAGRARLMRQLFTEGFVLAVAGGACGLLAAAWSLGLLWRLRPPTLEEGAVSLSLDGRVLAFTCCASLASALLISLAPALQTYRADLAAVLRGEPGFVRLGEKRLSLSHVLVIFQVALCALCLSGSGLFLRGLARAFQVDPGFDTAHLVSASFDLKAQGYDEARGRDFQRRLLERAAALPGVDAAALSENRVLGGFRIWREAVPAERGREAGSGTKNLVGSSIVSAGYFRTVGIPLEKGRDFTAEDREGTPPVAIANQAMARRYWPSGTPVGARVLLDEEGEPVEIVGVAGDSKYIDLYERPLPFLYLPLAQRYTPRATLNLRSAGAPEPLLEEARHALGEVDRALPVSDLLTASAAIERALWGARAGAVLLGVLGVLALVLATFGVYGITACSVVQRSREVGIRMALGASPQDVVKMLVRAGMTVVAVGLFFGLALAAFSGKWLSKLMVGIQGQDPVVLAVIAILLFAVGTLANVAPAVRAARRNPLVELRESE